MKKVLSTLAAILTLAAGGADAALTAWAPADYSELLLIDVRRLMCNRDVQRAIASPGVAERFAEVERAGLRIAGIRELAVLHWDDHWYGVMIVDGAAKLMLLLERHSADLASKIAGETVAGTRVYRLRRPPKKNGKHEKKELCLVFPGGDVVVLAKRVEVEAFLTCPRLDPAAAAQLADTDAELWYEHRGRDDAKGDDRKSDGPDVRLKHGSLMLRLTGAAGRDLEITGVGEYYTPEGAKSMSTALPGILAFVIGLVFAEDQEGGDELVQRLNTRVDGNTLMLSMDVPEPLLGRFLRLFFFMAGIE